MIFIADDDTLLMGSGQAVERELFDRLGGRPLPDLVELEQERDALRAALTAVVTLSGTDPGYQEAWDRAEQLVGAPSSRAAGERT